MPHYSVINTRSAPSLLVTVRAIAVCLWAQATDAAIGMRASAAHLWRNYRLQRAEERAWRDAHQTMWADEPEPEDPLDESALESLAREFGRPGWLSATLLALVISGAAIDLVGGWPVVLDLLQAIETHVQHLLGA